MTTATADELRERIDRLLAELETRHDWLERRTLERQVEAALEALAEIDPTAWRHLDTEETDR